MQKVDIRLTRSATPTFCDVARNGHSRSLYLTGDPGAIRELNFGSKSKQADR